MLIPRLYAPGPIRIPNEVKMAMMEDPPYFTTRGYTDLVFALQSDITHLVENHNPMLIGAGSGSLGMEVIVQNLFSPGDDVIVIENGKYGHNWAKICHTYGLRVMSIMAEYGKEVSLKAVEGIVKSHNIDFKGILVTHVETTTGVVNDVAGIKALRDKYIPNALMCIDAVSSFLTETFYVNDYDVVLTASQKALSCPPGLFLLFVSDRALTAAERCKRERFYFDIVNEMERANKGITTFTPASTLVNGLYTAVNEILKRGGQKCMIDLAQQGRYIVHKVLQHKFTLAGNGPNGVTAFYCDQANEHADHLEKVYNTVIGRGVRDWNDKVLRMMHFGWDLDLEDLENAAIAVVVCFEEHFGHLS